MEPLLHGALLALGLILPLGAQNLFVFNQGAVQPRFLLALPAVATASLCDTLLIAAAVTGVSAVVFQVPAVKTGFMIVGVLFLLYMGAVIWRCRPQADQSGEAACLSPVRQALFAASVSLLNPHAIADTIGVIGTSALGYPAGPERTLFALACAVVSWVWFLFLAVMGRLTGRLGDPARILAVVNKVSALLLWGTAVYLARDALS